MAKFGNPRGDDRVSTSSPMAKIAALALVAAIVVAAVLVLGHSTLVNPPPTSVAPMHQTQTPQQ